MSGSGTSEEESPLDTAVWRLRSRGCWQEAAALLTPYCADDPSAAVRRAALLAERCMYTASGWEEAEEALRSAEALARTDEQRGAAACERGHLAYAATVMGVRDRSDEARSALGRSAALLSPSAAGRPLLDFRRGLVAEHLSGNAPAARAAYHRAHAGAADRGDLLLCSSTWRHLAGLALRDGDLAEAGRGFAESLRLREELGYLVGMAPALASLAEVRPEPEAGRLRTEAARLVRLLDGIPTWLAEQLNVRTDADAPPSVGLPPDAGLPSAGAPAP
ncbi:hypothetical protein [Streptomyces sp. HB2AG]|uniref:hypothetical protein n=1 Tax=Streptomyces sp. HB2AG TaxID=2983400 RepID=UPI0022AB4826|nr:hypothetical protein [Streptomyces sp. HB2AG]MCZ2525466.1 hypothetical protein [Streptomyces sp. HB2AG]